MTVCNVCFRHCDIPEGGLGFCGARSCKAGEVYAVNAGRLTALALDPIEKKPLARFYPGSRILSAGSFGCNLRCRFCQNYDISWSEEAMKLRGRTKYVSPGELAAAAVRYKSAGNIGLAFTYNEPLISFEYIRETAKRVHEAGMKNVLVTNGCAEISVLEELAPYIDAMNIDLKGFTERYYREICGGSLEMVKAFIERAVQVCHVELTTLTVPQENDSEEEMREETAWIAGLTDADGNIVGKDIPLHISRFFPRFHMTDRPPTPVKTVYRLADIARETLNFVYTGNC